MEKRWIWPFELLDKLGEGGMGVVYRARYVKNDKIVAVKLLPEDLDQEIIKARFSRELEILKTLRHPNIVYCFGGTTDGDQQFYAMELVEGGTLEDILKQRKRLPWGEIIRLGVQICSGLAYAHKRGVVHRDIKPGNFLLSKDGILKLADFGLATVVDTGKLTKAGKTVGTLKYMAPEQIRGEEMTARTDLYALGCVFFELLTGRTPFTGVAAAQIMQEHLNTPPPSPSEEIPNLPKELENLILDLLEKDPENRPQNAEEVARRLREISEIKVKEKRSPISQSGSRSQEKRGSSNSRTTNRREEVPPPVPESFGTSRQLIVGTTGLLVLLLLLTFKLWGDLTEGEQAIALWEKTWHHGSQEAKIEAAKALGELAVHRKEFVNELRTVAENKDENPDLRMAAIEGLGKAGGVALNVVPVLSQIERTDENALVRFAARDAKPLILEGEVPGNSLAFSGAFLLVCLWAGFALWLFGKIRLPAFLQTKLDERSASETEANSKTASGSQRVTQVTQARK